MQENIPQETIHNTQETSKKDDTKSLLLFALIVLAIVLPIRIFVAKPFMVSGQSMYPTFDSWHYLIIDQLTYRFRAPQRGDVIVFHYPRNPKRYFIKRIIALPKETIHLEGTKTVIKNTDHPDGFILKESYVKPAYEKRNKSLTVTLGADEYFVMGDNRASSMDSRYWGPLEKRYITGRVLLRLYPFLRTHFFPGGITYLDNKE